MSGHLPYNENYQGCTQWIGPGDNDVCNRQGVVHVMWEKSTGWTSFACGEHRESTLTDSRLRQSHEAGTDCGKPGSVWTGENRCEGGRP